MGHHLPEPVKELLRPLVEVPPIDYLRNSARVRFDHLRGAYPPIHLTDSAPLLSDWKQHEDLFRRSSDRMREVVGPYATEIRWPLGKIHNRWFRAVDAELYYCMVRRYKPRMIVEVGTGYSARFAHDAMQRNGSGSLVCIDPAPRISLPQEARYIRAKVEDVDLALFGQMRENDILFIDSSHTTAEAKYHAMRILPKLRNGVVIHHHDFRYPWADYPGNKNQEEYGEQDILLDFYQRNTRLYEILVCASYVRFQAPNLIRSLFPSYRWSPRAIPGSLWTRKIPSAK